MEQFENQLDAIDNLDPFGVFLIVDTPTGRYIVFKDNEGFSMIINDDIFQTDINEIIENLTGHDITGINILVGYTEIDNIFGTAVNSVPEIITDILVNQGLIQFEQYELDINCAICLNNLEFSNDICKTRCGHYFHCDCIRQHTTYAQEALCPICRRALNFEEIEPFYDAEEEHYHDCEFGKKINKKIKIIDRDIKYLYK